jgi:hypothetical protein
MKRTLTRHLLASGSLLAAALALLPAGCSLIGGASECSVGQEACADEHTRLVCHGGEGSFHFSSELCDLGKTCQLLGPETAECLGSGEGAFCFTHADCGALPYCINSVCSPIPPAAVTACKAASTLDVGTIEGAPAGVTFATSLEPGEGSVAKAIQLDARDDGVNVAPCGDVSVGSERVVTLNVPATPYDGIGVRLFVTIEGLDSNVVPRLSGFAFEFCGFPLSLMASSCLETSMDQPLEIWIESSASTISIVLQTTEPLTESVPFTLRARMASRNDP